MTDEKFNHRAAAHRVDVMPFGTNVTIPYRGVTISLARDGGDTCAWCDDVEVVSYGEVPGTSGESIRKVMDLIDEYLEREPDYQQQALDYGELLIDICDELEYGYVSGYTQMTLKKIVEQIKKTNT